MRVSETDAAVAAALAKTRPVPSRSRSLRIFRTTTGWSGAFRDCLRSLPLVAGAAARPTIISWAAVRARGSGRLPPVRADLVARTVPPAFPSDGVADPFSQV